MAEEKDMLPGGPGKPGDGIVAPGVKPLGTIYYGYKILGGKWHNVEAQVESYLNNGEGWTCQGGVMFVEYHKEKNEAYCAQAIYREVPLTKEKE